MPWLGLPHVAFDSSRLVYLSCACGTICWLYEVCGLKTAQLQTGVSCPTDIHSFIRGSAQARTRGVKQYNMTSNNLFPWPRCSPSAESLKPLASSGVRSIAKPQPLASMPCASSKFPPPFIYLTVKSPRSPNRGGCILRSFESRRVAFLRYPACTHASSPSVLQITRILLFPSPMHQRRCLTGSRVFGNGRDCVMLSA